MKFRELGIGPPEWPELINRLARGAGQRLSEVLDEQLEAFSRHRCEQPCFVAEMVGRRGVRDADVAGDVPQAEVVCPDVVEGCHGGIDERPP
jgi:hypothetical protein